MIPNCIGYGYVSPRKMQTEIKTGQKAPTNDFAQRMLDWGKQNEEAAILQTIHQYNQFTNDKWKYVKTGIVYHPKLEDRLGATPDAVMTNGHEFINVEVKCPYYLAQQAPAEIKEMTKYDMLENNKYNWVIQAIAQMDCLPLEKTVFGVWTPHKTWIMELPAASDEFLNIWDELMQFDGN